MKIEMEFYNQSMLTMSNSMKKATQPVGSKKYNCHHCDAPCGDDFTSVWVESEDVYMGRFPQVEEKNWKRYCSRACNDYIARERNIYGLKLMIESCEDLEMKLIPIVRSIDKGSPDFEQLISRLKRNRLMLLLSRACVKGEPIQELIRLQSKVLKYLGDEMETYHTDSKRLNNILKDVKIVETLDLDLLGS